MSYEGAGISDAGIADALRKAVETANARMEELRSCGYAAAPKLSYPVFQVGFIEKTERVRL